MAFHIPLSYDHTIEIESLAIQYLLSYRFMYMNNTIVGLQSQLENKKKRITALTYLIFFLPRFTEWKAEPEMHFHERQAIGLLIFALSLQGILSILVYWGAPHTILVWAVRIVLLYLLYIGAKNALASRMEPLPWIGKYAERIF